MTLSTLCKYLNNWFETAICVDTYTIEDGVIDLSDLEERGRIQNNQYFRIAGSVFNDGVYQYTDELTTLTDETFYGSVSPMAIPSEVMQLLADITAWETKIADDPQADSPYQSESFGGYSYTKAGNGTGDSSDATTVFGHFKGRLAKWRKI